MERFEYKTIKIETRGMMGGILPTEELDSRMNALGEEGWELVSCFTTNQGNGYSREAVAVFKRKR